MGEPKVPWAEGVVSLLPKLTSCSLQRTMHCVNSHYLWENPNILFSPGPWCDRKQEEFKRANGKRCGYEGQTSSALQGSLFG
jgi:hypothetical protein